MADEDRVNDPDAVVRIPRLRIEKVTVSLGSMAEVTITGLEAELELGAELRDVLTGASSVVESAVDGISGDGESGIPDITTAALERAHELDIDPSGVDGTGQGGRILVSDVEAAASPPS